MSNKKPFEYIEDKIKLAAENNLPAFDEKAWDAMAVKLDKVEKKRRPFFIWWIVLPLIFAGAWGGYELFKPSGKTKDQLVIAATTTDNIQQLEKGAPAINKRENTVATVEKNSGPAGMGNSGVIDNKKKTGTGATDDKAILNKRDEGAVSPQVSSLTLTGKKMIAGRKKGKMTSHTSGGADEETKEETVKENIVANTPEKRVPVSNEESSFDKPAIIDNNKKPVGIKNKSNTLAAVENKNDTAKIDTSENKKPEEKPATAKTKKQENRKATGFYLLAAGGMDAGSTKLFSLSNSTITPKYGIGIGYQLNQKLSVQTGFYATNKKYIAGPDDYHAKAGSYWSEVQMQQVKAACLVFEIPITVRYNFIQRPSITWYGTIGTASYIMQKEDYDYFYISYNMPHEKKWQYTGNKHFLSTLIFSAGIEKKLSAKLSLLFEPSFSIPLTGVGDGKVKLFSSSLLAGIKYLPFVRHK